MWCSGTVGNIVLTLTMDASMSMGLMKDVSCTLAAVVAIRSCVLGVDGLVAVGVIISCKIYEHYRYYYY